MKRTPTPAQIRWWASAKFRAASSASAKNNLLRFAAAPKCGAKRKRDGQPCEQPGLGAGGRCRFHGGGTGAGENWHKPVWPSRDTPEWERKFNRKLADLERARKKRDRRIAAMTDDERAAHRTWHASHHPGPLGPRARQRAEREQAADFRARIGIAPERPLNPELIRLEAEIAALQAELDSRAAETIDRTQGVFS